VFVGRVHQTYRLTVDLTVGWLEGEGGGRVAQCPVKDEILQYIRYVARIHIENTKYMRYICSIYKKRKLLSETCELKSRPIQVYPPLLFTERKLRSAWIGTGTLLSSALHMQNVHV